MEQGISLLRSRSSKQCPGGHLPRHFGDEQDVCEEQQEEDALDVTVEEQPEEDAQDVTVEELITRISNEFEPSLAHAMLVQLLQELEAAKAAPGYAGGEKVRLSDETRRVLLACGFVASAGGTLNFNHDAEQHKLCEAHDLVLCLLASVNEEYFSMEESRQQAFIKAVEEVSNEKGLKQLFDETSISVKADRICMLAAVRKCGRALYEVADCLKADKQIVLEAVKKDNLACLFVADSSIRADEEVKEVVVQAFMRAVEDPGFDDYQAVPNLLAIAPPFVKEDRACVLKAVIQNGRALQFVADIWKGDPEVVWMAVNDTNNKAWRDLNNEDMMHAFVGKAPEITVIDLGMMVQTIFFAAHILNPPKTRNYGSESGTYETKFHFADQTPSFQFAAESLKRNKQFVIAVVSKNGVALEYVADILKQDKEVVLAAVKQNRNSVKYASPFPADRQFLLQLLACTGVDTNANESDKSLLKKAVNFNGHCLMFGTRDLRADREIVLEAVRRNSEALKFAMSLNQDHECLKAAGIWDETPVVYRCTQQAMLSVKFSLAEQSTPYATQFHRAMKTDSYLGQFKTYNPNAWCKKSCDPNFTDINHHCRGTLSTCGYPASENLSATNRPADRSCWRFAFRFHQDECKVSNGFMIQVEEMTGLGNGQKLETEMAKQVGLKIFRTYTNLSEVDQFWMGVVAKRVRAWYHSQCTNMNLENIQLSETMRPDEKRPDFEPDMNMW